MAIKSDLKELVENGVLTQEAADDVANYYLTKKNNSNKALIVFGVIGALSIGLGIISIIASNWDAYSRFTKTAFSLLPLILGQLLAGYTLLKQKESAAWKEASAVFLLLAFGAVMSMIGQVYNLPANLHSFITVWIWSAIPLLYLFNSSAVALLFLAGITVHSFMFAEVNVDDITDHSFWIFLTLYLPYYISGLKNKVTSFGLTLQHWLLPIVVFLAFIPLQTSNEELILLTYLSLFSVTYILGQQYIGSFNTSAHSAFTWIGTLGIIGIVVFLSFDDVFEELMDGFLLNYKWQFTLNYIIPTVTSVLGVGLIIKQFISVKLEEISSPMLAASSVLVVIFVSQIIQLPHWTGLILSMAIGAHMIKKATESSSMASLNIGLVIVLIPIISRFMNARMDFVIKGIVLIVLGIGFILVNVFIKRKMRAGI